MKKAANYSYPVETDSHFIQVACMLSASLSSRGFSTFIVEKLDLEPTSANRLKAMGVFEGQQIELTRQGNPLIVKAAGSRVAIAADLAKRILVRDVDE